MKGKNDLAKTKLQIRILDADPNRLMRACKYTNQVMREYALDAQVISVDEHLEIYRMGLAEKMPALEINEYVVSVRTEITKELLIKIFKPLTQADNK